MQTITQLMTRSVVTLSPELTLREAATLLLENQISGAPVIADNGQLIGILTESDLLNEAKKRAAIPRTAAFGIFLASEETLQRLYHFGADLAISEVMTRDLVTITEQTTVSEAAQLLVKKKINRLPVLSADGMLLGIVTREDLLKAVFAQ